MWKQIEELKKGDFVYWLNHYDDIRKGEVENVTMYHTVVIVKVKGLYAQKGYGYVSGIKGGYKLYGRHGTEFYTLLEDAEGTRDKEKEKSQFYSVWYHMNELKRKGITVSISL